MVILINQIRWCAQLIALSFIRRGNNITRLAFLRILLCLLLAFSCTTYYRPPFDRQQALRKSHAILTPEEIASRDSLVQSFLNHIKVYLGTPYQLGGYSREGIDCSGFVSIVFNECFKIEVPHKAYQIYESCQKIKRSELNLGDLVFFRNRKKIDHVGIYLIKNYFVHASVSDGVTVSELTEKYYRTRFSAAGRIIDLNTVAKRE